VAVGAKRFVLVQFVVENIDGLVYAPIREAVMSPRYHRGTTQPLVAGVDNTAHLFLDFGKPSAYNCMEQDNTTAQKFVEER
jgi:hypothetical protein